MAIALGVAALVVLVLITAFLAEAEVSLLRISRIRVRYLVEKKVDKAQKLEKLIRDPDQFLPPLLLTVLIIQLATAPLSAWLMTRLTGNAGVGATVGTLSIAIILFIFAELIPKAIASHQPEKVALRVTRPITLVTRIVRPFSWLFQMIALGLLRVFTGRSLADELLVADEGEIRAMVSAAEEHDIIELEEKDMIHSVFEFSDTLVREVMVPRPDMVALPSTATVAEALMVIIDHGFSRIPVFGQSLDDIKGVLYAKDLMPYLRGGQLEGLVSRVVREAFIIPETKVLSHLLRDLRKRKVHMAIVVDEYGTVVGLVTIEDLLEEIVGEIFDEFDREVTLIEKVDDNRYRVDARMNLGDLKEILQVDLPEEEDVDTVGGLVLKILGHVPVAGETFTYNGVSVRVEKVRNNRISKVLMDLLPKPAESETRRA